MTCTFSSLIKRWLVSTSAVIKSAYVDRIQLHMLTLSAQMLATVMSVAMEDKGSCLPAYADEDKERVGLIRARRGVFGRVAGALSLSSPSRKQAADDSLADQWLDFLIQQADAADAAETAAALPTEKAVTPLQQSSRPALGTQLQLHSPSQRTHNWSSLQTS